MPQPDPGPNGGTAYLCAADRDGLLVSLIQTNFSAAGCGPARRRLGHQPPEPGLVVPARRVASERARRRQAPDAHADPRARVRGTGKPWLVFGAMGGHTQAQTHLQVLTHLAHDGDDPQAAITAPRWAVDPDFWHVQIEVRVRRRAGRRVARAWPRCATSAAPSTTAWAMRTRSNARCPATGPRPIRAPKARPRACSRRHADATQLPSMVVSNTRVWTIPNLISRPAARVRARCSSGCSGARTSRSPPPVCSRSSARPTGSTATSPGTSTRGASSARSSTRPPTA